MISPLDVKSEPDEIGGLCEIVVFDAEVTDMDRRPSANISIGVGCMDCTITHLSADSLRKIADWFRRLAEEL